MTFREIKELPCPMRYKAIVGYECAAMHAWVLCNEINCPVARWHKAQAKKARKG